MAKCPISFRCLKSTEQNRTTYRLAMLRWILTMSVYISTSCLFLDMLLHMTVPVYILFIKLVSVDLDTSYFVCVHIWLKLRYYRKYDVHRYVCQYGIEFKWLYIVGCIKKCKNRINWIILAELNKVTRQYSIYYITVCIHLCNVIKLYNSNKLYVFLFYQIFALFSIFESRYVSVISTW